MQQPKILKNFLLLLGLQASGFILPLISFPYLARTLGIEVLGIFSLVQAISIIVTVIADYGYITTGTQRVSVHRDDYIYLGKLINASLSLRLLIACLASCIGIFYLIFALPSGQVELLSLLSVLTMALLGSLNFPWFFQGIERMPQFTLILVASRVGSVILLFLLVSGPRSLSAALWINILPQLVGAIYCLYYFSKKLMWRYEIPKFSIVKEEAQNGWHFFTPTFYSIFFTQMGLVALGLYQSQAVVGGYAVMDRLAKAVASINGAVNQAVYPQAALAMSRSHAEGVQVIKKYAAIFLPFFLLVCIALAIASPLIVKLLFGQVYVKFSDALSLLAIFIFASAINTFIGVIYMTTSGRQKEYSNAVLFGTCLAMLIYFLAPKLIGYYAPVLGLISGESAILIFIVYKLLKGDKNYV
ncbi:oligosaccharide flippase family protein [Deinococcus marmoris]|uniref:oligosaccharide flippase family protein n=1 Tax=Deinococcus marmoris TaxID=249408 RepID=UPI0009E06107|nr:oligosaccharide flippase family protein [Deinococcus marmoris]